MQRLIFLGAPRALAFFLVKLLLSRDSLILSFTHGVHFSSNERI